MNALTPHKALLALHRLVDQGLYPLVGAMGFELATESIMTVDRADLVALQSLGDPQAALVNLAPAADVSALVVSEPGLSNAILESIWRRERGTHAEETRVETAILQQFLSDVCTSWRAAWRDAGTDLLPSLTLVSTISLAQAHLTDGPWYVARTLVFENGQEVGVLLFCYPARLLPALEQARRTISWRHRITSGMTEHQRELLQSRLYELRGIPLTAPVTYSTELPLRTINDVSRGDVIAFDVPAGAEMQLRILDQPVNARLARSEDSLALAVGSDVSANGHLDLGEAAAGGGTFGDFDNGDSDFFDLPSTQTEPISYE